MMSLPRSASDNPRFTASRANLWWSRSCFLVLQRILGVFAPLVCRGDDDAMREWLFAGGGKEAVDVTFLQAVVFGIQLALNSMVFARATGFGDKINAGITCIQPLQFCPIAIRPNITI